MSFAEDLLDVARDLADRDPEALRQASLRRAVSTAYYALFHLLIAEATANWSRAELRPALGRIFEHGKMKSASTVDQVAALNPASKNKPYGSAEPVVVPHLLVVAKAFLQAQQQREDADYNTSREWTRVDVLRMINAVSKAFESWKLIREEPEAQAYLVSLLGKQGR